VGPTFFLTKYFRWYPGWIFPLYTITISRRGEYFFSVFSSPSLSRTVNVSSSFCTLLHTTNLGIFILHFTSNVNVCSQILCIMNLFRGEEVCWDDCCSSEWNYRGNSRGPSIFSLVNDAASYRGTRSVAGRSRVRFPMMSLDSSFDLVLTAALWPRGRLSLTGVLYLTLRLTESESIRLDRMPFGYCALCQKPNTSTWVNIWAVNPIVRMTAVSCFLFHNNRFWASNSTFFHRTRRFSRNS
jgi:hypothetical protein